MPGPNTTLVVYRKPADEVWFEDAYCNNMETDLFYNFQIEEEPNPEQRRIMSNICINCPVMELCQAYAVKYNENGWWGMTTKRERFYLRRRIVRRGTDIMQLSLKKIARLLVIYEPIG